jgi:hypothetical protein
VLAAGTVATVLAVRYHAHLGTAAPPFTGRYILHLDGWLAAPAAVATAVLVAASRGVHLRLPWGALLAVGYLAALAWTLALTAVRGWGGLSRSLTGRTGYLHDVGLVGNDPLHFLATFVAHADRETPLGRTHPPGPVLLLWTARQLGVHSPTALGVLVCALGVLSVPLVLVAVRSLCHEPAARRLSPLLVLAPYALWIAVTMDAVTLAITCGFIVCGVRASESGRSWWWAVAAGLLVGLAALFSYSAPWSACSVIVVYFVRRRPLLNVATGIGALAPLLLATASGFDWAAGLSAAQAYSSASVGRHLSWLAWGFLDLAVVAAATGPGVVAAARRIRRTPGWPFLVGAVLAIGFAVFSGLSRGQVERSMLPLFPWLLVPATAPADSPRTPLLLTAVGGVGAIALAAALRTPW